MQLRYPHRLWADLETRSGNPITHGSYVYAEDSEVLLFMYALDNAPVQVWDAASGQPMPRDLHDYMSAGQHVELAFHNTGFDRVQLLTWPWARQYPMPAERFYCTMTAARLAGLPGGLDELCRALEIPDTYAKKDGNALIRKFCTPDSSGRFVQPWEAPQDWARFVDYGVQDVVAMREAMRRIPDMLANPATRTHMAYSDIMNDRGIPVDRDLATKAMLQADRYKRDAKRTAVALTGNDEFNPASQKAILELAASYGIKLDDARGATLEKLLDSAVGNELLPPTLQKVLTLRVRSNKASTAKFSSLLKGTNWDDRARGLVSFGGAGRTGRDAGRRFQPQNLARPVYVGERMKNLTMGEACDIIKAGTAEMHVDNPMQLLSDAVRGTVAASFGRKFCGADLSAIEGRVLPWLMGEHWKVQYFRDLDAGRVKYDGYQLAYSVAFGVDPSTVTKAQRTLGKPVELATGFGGGVGALITFAALYRIDLDVMAAAAREVADRDLWQECVKSYNWFNEKGLTYGLHPDTWTGCQYIVKAWRRKHPATVEGWKRAEDAFRAAIHSPGVQFTMAHNTYVVNHQGWLFVTLPSGRQLVYPRAFEVMPSGKDRGQLGFWGVNPFTKKWGIIYTYSGKLSENITQAVACDVLFWAVPKVEAAGYPIILRVHDEILSETPDIPRYSGRELAKIMATPHPWCHDLPLNAVGEDTYRYQK